MRWKVALNSCASILKQGSTFSRSSITLLANTKYVDSLWNFQPIHSTNMLIWFVWHHFASAEGIPDVESSSSWAKTIWHGEGPHHSDLQAEAAAIAQTFQGKKTHLSVRVYADLPFLQVQFFSMNLTDNFRNALMGFTEKLKFSKLDK